MAETESPSSPSGSGDATAEGEAAAAAKKGDPAADVRAWLLEAHSATLCTLAAQPDVEGWPFGSIVPFALTAEGRPFILIADIAAHTKNLLRDPRASLFVHQPRMEGDPQSGWRATLLGTWERVLPDDDERERKGPQVRVSRAAFDELEARYRERVPSSESYFQTHGFAYWQIGQLAKVRYIAGFGKICWVDGERILRAPLGEGLDEAARGAIDHMNADHKDGLLAICRHLGGVDADDAELVGLDRTGFLLRAAPSGRLVHASYGREIGARDLRGAAVELVQRARARATASG